MGELLNESFTGSQTDEEPLIEKEMCADILWGGQIRIDK
jgi:hypothetical protein